MSFWRVNNLRDGRLNIYANHHNNSFRNNDQHTLIYWPPVSDDAQQNIQFLYYLL